MHPSISRSATALALIASVGLTACNSDRSQSSSDPSASTTAAIPKGPHGGRLLTDGSISIEMLIFEDHDAAPRFHVYASSGNKALAPTALDLSVTLKRLGGQVDELHFVPEADHLTSQTVVEEPHSFDVAVAAKIQGVIHRWAYASPEGRLKLPAAEARAKGVTIEAAGPATLEATRIVGGAIVASPTPTVAFNLNKVDLVDVHPGLAVELMTIDGHSLGRSNIASVKPLFEEGSRTTVITVPLSKEAAAMPIGTALTGRIIIGTFPVPLAVRTVALQHFRNFRVVLANFGEDYEVRVLDIGRQTPEWTEVKSGLKPGTPYVSANAYVLGANLDKNTTAAHVD